MKSWSLSTSFVSSAGGRFSPGERLAAFFETAALAAGARLAAFAVAAGALAAFAGAAAGRATFLGRPLPLLAGAPDGAVAGAPPIAAVTASSAARRTRAVRFSAKASI